MFSGSLHTWLHTNCWALYRGLSRSRPQVTAPSPVPSRHQPRTDGTRGAVPGGLGEAAALRHKHWSSDGSATRAGHGCVHLPPTAASGSPSIRTLCSAGASPHPGLLMLRACGLRGGAFPGTCGGQTPRTGTTAHTGQGSPQAPRQLSRFLGLVLQLDWGGSHLFKRLHQCPWGRELAVTPTPQGSHITPAPNAHLQLDHPGVQPKNLATCVLANSPRLLARAQGGQDGTRGQSTGAPGD